MTWAQRTPKHAPAVAHELAAALDQRARALGEQLAANPEPWDAQIKHDQAGSADATALARHMAAQREQLETANARYQTWATDTSNRRETAGKARVEVQRRGLAQHTAG